MPLLTGFCSATLSLVVFAVLLGAPLSAAPSCPALTPRTSQVQGQLLQDAGEAELALVREPKLLRDESEH